MSNLTFTIPGNPKGKGRPRMTRGGMVYTPAETAKYENLVRLSFTAARLDAHLDPAPAEGPVTLELTATYQIPASWSRKKTEAARSGIMRHTSRPDLDNVVKAVLDGLNGVAFRDDAQVYVILARKQYGDTPGVTVDILSENS